MLVKTTELLNKSELLYLASINAQGYPRVCVVTKLNNDGLNKIYIATGTNCNKTKQFQANSKASLCFHNEQDSAILIGHVNIVECMELKKALWQDWLFEHIPGGTDDPEYCILEFIANEATVYIQGQMQTLTVN